MEFEHITALGNRSHETLVQAFKAPFFIYFYLFLLVFIIFLVYLFIATLL